MKKVLIVDDEFHMRKLLKLYLCQENYLVEEAENGKEAVECVEKNDYDIMILDVMMPLLDGWQTLEKVREISDLPILMLTAKASVQDKVSGLTLGADDYLVKPFDENELMARIQALLRRSGKVVNEEVLAYKGIRMNLAARDVSFEGSKITLTQTEFDLLEALMKHKGKVLSREQFVELIWGIEFLGEDRTVDSHIRNLREKLKNAGADKSYIKTVWGIGYKIE